jgi:hypothetical protein
MSDVNFSVAAGMPPNQQGDTAQLWSFHGVKPIAGPGGTVVLHKRGHDRTMLVQPDVAEALSLCSPFRTLESHTRTVISLLPALAEHPEHTLQTLAGIAEAGLFESSEEAWERLTANSDANANAATKNSNAESVRVFILTCDRPAALQRLLAGLLETALPPQVESVWVIDDSRDDANISANASAIADAQGVLSIPVHHIDQGMKTNLIEHITSQLAGSESALSWLLDHDQWAGMATYGVARNLSLLMSVGYRALVLDDDVIPQAIAAPLSAASLKVGVANDRESVFYANHEELNRHALVTPSSPLAMVLQHLGRSLGQILKAELPSHRDLAGWDGALLSRCAGPSPALLNQCGSWGDSGTGGAQGLVYLGGASIKRLMDASEPLETVLGARASWFGYRGPMLTQYGTMSQLTGIDHRALLPPYLPAGRGEDILFGVMLQRLHPESMVYNEGWAIRHAPLEERSARGALPPLTASAGINLLADWLGREPADQWGLTPERRLLGLAEQLTRLSEMDAPALEAMIKEELIAKRTNLLNRCMRHLSQLGPLEELPRTGEWRAFLEGSRDQLVSEIQAPEADALASAGGKLGSDGLDLLRRHGESFSEALTLWPGICEAASQFKP